MILVNRQTKSIKMQNGIGIKSEGLAKAEALSLNESRENKTSFEWIDHWNGQTNHEISYIKFDLRQMKSFCGAAADIPMPQSSDCPI